MISTLQKVGAVASIGFNLMFIGGYAYQNYVAPSPAAPDGPGTIEVSPQPESSVVDDLNLHLNAQQKEAIGEVQSQLQQEQASTQQNMYLTKQALWQEMSRPEPDQQRISELNQEVRDLHQQLREQQSQQFNEFMNTLNPEQRQAVVNRAKKQQEKRYGHFHRKVMEKFDANGDGQLSEEERRSARQKMMKHHKKRLDDTVEKFRTPENSDALDQMNHDQKKEFVRDQMRKKMLEKYDSNGDGKLDDAEKRKLRKDRMKEFKKHRDRKHGEKKQKKPHNGQRFGND